MFGGPCPFEDRLFGEYGAGGAAHPVQRAAYCGVCLVAGTFVRGALTVVLAPPPSDLIYERGGLALAALIRHCGVLPSFLIRVCPEGLTVRAGMADRLITRRRRHPLLIGRAPAAAAAVWHCGEAVAIEAKPEARL